MKILIVGGTGFAGGYTALHLKAKGHDVTIMGRSRPKGSSALNELPWLRGNYIEDDFGNGELKGFEGMVFCAGNDITQMPQDGSVSPETFFHDNNTVAIPRFFEKAKAAGITRAAYLGSFYSHVAPHRIEEDPYVASRHRACEAIRTLSDTGFSVSSISAPFILGHVPGLEAAAHLSYMANYARGLIPDLPVFAPVGGTNHVNLLTVAEALEGALLRGESGKAYLIGDANLSWKDYLEAWFTAAGNPQDIPVRSDDHPLLPNVIMYAGVGATVSYQNDPDEQELLGYGTGRITAEIAHCAKVY